MKKWIGILLATLLLTLPVFAHSGRTDSSGGHRDTKNASGLGSYHYHHGYGPHLHPNGVCPYSSASAASTTPAATSTTPSLKSTTPAAAAQTTPTGKTNAEKAAFLDKYIALMADGETEYHTIDCADFDSTKSFVAYNLSAAKSKGYTACAKCHK